MKNIFWKLEANESLIILCLQIYRELLSLATFLRVHSKSKEVSYLYWQDGYPKLKVTCHIKLNFFLWTKPLESLLLAKYIITVDATLRIFSSTARLRNHFILVKHVVWSRYLTLKHNEIDSYHKIVFLHNFSLILIFFIKAHGSLLMFCQYIAQCLLSSLESVFWKWFFWFQWHLEKKLSIFFRKILKK